MKPIYKCLLAAIVCFSFCGCHDETYTWEQTRENEKMISLQVSVPVDNLPLSKTNGQSQAGLQENMIQQIDVLVFRVENGGAEYFDYYTEGKITAGAGTAKQTFIAKLKVQPYNQRLVIIANARNEVLRLIGEVEWKKAPKEEMLKVLDFTNRAADHKWNTTDPAKYTPFPMWGETPVALQISSATSVIEGIQMMRMVAKIDIAVAEDNPAKNINPRNNFRLTEVYLYNVKDKGSIVPDKETLGLDNNGSMVVHKPTIPEEETNWKGPALYKAFDATGLFNTIYTPEVKAADLSENPTDATGLVIGGYYSSDGLNWSTSPLYYRLDMMTEDKSATSDILRNYNYLLNITQVNGPGHPTPYVAWDSKIPVHMMVADWSIVKINGNPQKRQLYTSATRASITGVSSSRIYFWSDQSSVQVEEQGYTGNIPFLVNDFFDDLSGASATSTFHYNAATGEGYMDIMTTSTQQTSDLRKIYLNAGGLRREITINTEIRSSPRLFHEFPWVGTFHRKDEVGERVIYSAHTGSWSAEVDDPEGKGHFVILSKIAGGDPGFHTEFPGSAEDYPVLEGLKSVNGNGRVFFRVGMTSKYSPRPGHPARYATITIKHSNGSSKMYVRQGEDADYLMRNGDKPTRNSDLTVTRSMANKISPYNLTDLQAKSGRVGNETGSLYDFTRYPTQGGYYFQFGRTYAWYPDLGDAVNWIASDPNGFWETNRNDWECCPEGFRRPNDGSSSSYVELPQANESEIRQSLFLNPRNGAASSNDNIRWGYYADGFFDRRIPRMSYNGEPASVVGNGADLAYIGQLFFNPYNNASLFIPASGIRNDNDKEINIVRGRLKYTGSRGFFWSTTSFSTDNGWYLSNDRGRAVLFNASLRNGFPVRCIQY